MLLAPALHCGLKLVAAFSIPVEAPELGAGDRFGILLAPFLLARIRPPQRRLSWLPRRRR
jgi:hypothetical protein